MPLIESKYKASGIFKHQHLATLFPAMFRRRIPLPFRREQITTKDHDFFEVDWLENNNKNLIIILHGVEGSSNSKYVNGISRKMFKKGYDIAAINNRGCGGKDNFKAATYHAAFYDDVEYFVNYADRHYNYDRLFIIGYSLGGSILLNYLSRSEKINPKVKAAIAMSCTLDFITGGINLLAPKNKIYAAYFMGKIKRKARRRKKLLKEAGVDVLQLLKAANIRDIDNLYTVKVFKFKSARTYWKWASVLPHLEKINIPTLILNAKDDPLLTRTSYPYKIAEKHPYIYLETPEYGGHLGFYSAGKIWADDRVAEFFEEISSK